MLILLLLSISQPAHSRDDWQVAAEGVSYGLIALDWLQTGVIARDPDHVESNKYLGPHPSNAEVNRYFAARTLLHVSINHLIPWERYGLGWCRDVINIQAIYVHGGAAMHNARLGITLKFSGRNVRNSNKTPIDLTPKKHARPR